MKRMKYIITCLCAVLLSTSCDSFLDITPQGQIKRDELITTPEGIEDAMYGVYASMRSKSLYGEELYFSALEIMANTMTCSGNTKVEALGKFDYDHSSVESVFDAVWTKMYKNISNVNSVLHSPLLQSDNLEFPYNIYKGEALGLRAFMHFDLVRLFCPQITEEPNAVGIPYATDFSLRTPPMGTLENNFKRILDDLYAAEKLLESEADYKDATPYMLDRQIHFNLYAVQATLARVLLTMGKKEEACVYAKKVIENSGYQLKEKTEVLNDLAGVMSRKETIFGIYYADFFTTVYDKLQQTVSFSSLNLRGDFMSVYEEDLLGNDFRINAYFTEQDNGGTPIYRLSKFTDIYALRNMEAQRPKDLILGINIIRIPEMYYIVAEALLDTDPKKALEYFDAVIEHRGLTPYSQRDIHTDLTLEMINKERFKEYIGEGQTFFNMKRLGLPIKSHDGNTDYTTDNYIVPIPDAEFEYREY